MGGRLQKTLFYQEGSHALTSPLQSVLKLSFVNPTLALKRTITGTPTHTHTHATPAPRRTTGHLSRPRCRRPRAKAACGSCGPRTARTRSPRRRGKGFLDPNVSKGREGGVGGPHRLAWAGVFWRLTFPQEVRSARGRQRYAGCLPSVQTQPEGEEGEGCDRACPTELRRP